jgi:hypothetical protein
MPVPFPIGDEIDLSKPDAMGARTVAGGVATAAAPAGGLTSLQRMLIEAVTESMTGFVVAARALPRLDAQQFAHVLAHRDEKFRARMVQFMLLCALVLNPLPEEVVDRIDGYAHELGVSNDMLRIARRFARGSYGLALIDFQRSGYMETWDPGRSAVLHTSGELDDAWQSCVHDESLAARWIALRNLPEGTLGREVVKFYDARGFEFPGRPGSAPPLLAQHDWVHVLADYGSTVESEIEVFAFISRANDDPRAFSLLAQIVSLFETGYTASGLGLFAYDRGHLSHQGMAVRLADAMRRGALTAAANGSIDFLAIDWFAYADHTVDDVRREMSLIPKDPRAIEAGSVTPWEKGGISPFQYENARKRAEARGRPYDSYGAVPNAVADALTDVGLEVAPEAAK